MYELIKKSYEISLWGEKTITIDDEKGKNSYIKEYKIATIGSDTMESPIKAFEPKLVRQTNGTNTLTFQIFYQYYDEEENKFKLNPFISLLANERKVKLSYDGKWYDFIIKQVQEDSQKRTYTYTCQDLYITELSKNGYSLVFDTELENNMGSVTDLGTEILKGTEWSIDKNNSDIIIQKNEEAVFTYELQEEITKYKIYTFMDGYYNSEGSYIKATLKEEDGEEPIHRDKVVYIGYNSYITLEEGKELFFIYVPGADPRTDEDNVITNGILCSFIPNWTAKPVLKQTTSYRGVFPVSGYETVYVPQIQRYCTVYEYKENSETPPKEYYGFVGSEFLGATEVQNLLTNSNNFIKGENNGWSGKVTIENKDKITFDLATGEVKNSGLVDSFGALQDNKGFSEGDVFYFLIKQIYGTLPTLDIKFKIGENEIADSVLLNNSLADGYVTYKITCKNSVSYSDLIDSEKPKPEFVLSGDTPCSTSEVSLFREVKYKTTENGEEKTKIILPKLTEDLEAILDTAIKDRYFFFDPDNPTGNEEKIFTDIDDIAFFKKCFKEEIATLGFTPKKKSEPFEKITSITASKSNRFNLIQELCETFECWARFEIGHDQIGAVKHVYQVTQDTSEVQGKKYYTWRDGIAENDKNINDPTLFVYTDFANGVYEHILDKKVVFRQYIGQDNHAGFRYGINLKGITRDIDSKQIVTKLIVESNSNQYANDGFCSIQRATMNPTRENTIYNFKYYINNGLIDKDELIADLYDEDSIGLYPKLLNINLAAEPGIAKLVELKTARDKALAAYTYHKFAEEEAANNEVEYSKQINDFTGGKGPSNGKDYNDTIKELQRKLEYAESAKNEHGNSKAYYKEIYDNYEEQVKNLEEFLATYTEQKEQLYSEFFKKYSRFVQEGTWISEEYFDPDLYYFDACKVSETSAFPQITYNINVLDLSGMEEYQNYKFEIGDKTYIEDIEFFGYNQETGRPYQEEVIVSEIHSFLDSPEKDSIKVKNYKTRFEDLFQRVAAATQALQYHEGEYNRASSAIKKDNTIDGSVLERTLNYNYVLSDAISKEIAQGGQVIDLNSVLQPNRYVRLSGLGIQLSKDGGLNWQTAITADGINADVGVFGSLHTNNLTIYNGDTDAFFWNADGITAFGADNTGTQYNKFVRFSKYGIYGHIGENGYEYNPESVSTIMNNSVFALTWNGFALNSLSGGNYVRISTEGEKDEHGKKIIRAGSSEDITEDGDTTTQNVDKFIIYEDGTVYAKGEIHATAGSFTEDVTFGGKLEGPTGKIGGWEIDPNKGLYNTTYALGLYTTPQTVNSKSNIVFCAGSNFYVDSDGHLTATDGTFSGTLTAASGNFSGKLTGKPVETESYFALPTGFGYFGKGRGSKIVTTNGVETEESTNGIVITQNSSLANSTEGILDTTIAASNKIYVFVSDGGVRLQAGDNRITVTPNSIKASDKTKSVNLLEGGGGTAVFG